MSKAWISVTVRVDNYTLKRRLRKIQIFVYLIAWIARILKVPADVDIHEPMIKDLITVDSLEDKPPDLNRFATQLGPAPYRDLNAWHR